MYKKTYRIEGTEGVEVVVAGKKYELGEDISYKVMNGLRRRIGRLTSRA